MRIDFSGVDGSGKTSAFNVFCDELERLGARVLRTKEIGNPHLPVATKLREMILHEAELPEDSFQFICAALRLYNLSYYDKVAEQYDFIVSDRGWYCHIAYCDATCGESLTDALFFKYLGSICGDGPPNLTIYCHADPDVMHARRLDRVHETGELDVVEGRGLGFLEEVRACYERAIVQDAAVVSLPTDGPREVIADRVRELARGIFLDQNAEKEAS